MGLLDRFRKIKDDDPERTRRNHLLANGRLTDGIIIDTQIEGGREMVRFEYVVQGVQFECFEFLTHEQILRPQDYAPGASVGVRYDPRSHSNSIVV